MLESIGELPSHPLFVHAPIVLTPLVAILAFVLAVRPQWRRRLGLVLPISAAGIALATMLARESGERLSGLLGDFAPNTDKHESLANTALVMTLLLLGTSTVTVLADRFGRVDGREWLERSAKVFVSLSVIFAGLATIWMFRAGHEGARLVWKGTIQSMAAMPLW